MKASRAAASLLVGVSTIAFPAMAQTDASAPASASQTADETSQTQQTQDIIVTGSRTIKNGDASPTPVTIVTTESLNSIRPAATISDQLNTVPVFSGSRQATSFGRGTGLTGGGNGAANQLNLRNVGSNRNLILLDGRRVSPSTSFNVVDSDVIPSMLVQRVDVVTGGVSAVYGSDAVSGVVNFIIDRNFQGVLTQGSMGISRYGDGRTINAGIAAGTKFADGRGHFELSYEYRDDKGVLSRASRPWFTQATVGGAGTTANPGILIENGRLPALPFGGRINGCGTGCTLNGQYFASNGVLSPFVNGTAVNNGQVVSGIQVGGDGGYYDSSLKAPLTMHQLFARFDYDLTDDVHFFAYGSANFKKNLAYVQTLTLNNVTLRSNNPFLSPAYQAALLATSPTFTFGRIIDQGETREGYQSSADQYIGVVGFEGKTAGIDWNLAYNYGNSILKTTMLNNVNQQRLAAALDPVVAGGNIVCRINADAFTTNDDSACVPLNPFGPSATSQAALDYILQPGHFQFNTRMDDVVADATASPFNTWAGPVTIALSGEWRQLRAWSTSDTLPSQLENCQGIQYNCSATTPVWRQSFAQTPKITQSVWEAAGEVDVPLLKDVTLVKSLSVNGAVRYTDYYDSVGSYWTWKVGGSWEVNDDIRLRGTISRDIRAPTLADLYAPNAVSFSNQQDLLTGNTVFVPFIQIGNPDLKAEIGSTKTAGIVWKPHFLPGFSAAVDYYSIKITNAITQVSGTTSAFQNLCYSSGGTSPYCAFQDRPIDYTTKTAANNVTAFYNQPTNIGSLKTSGVDIELNYASRLFGKAFSLRGLASYQPHIRYIQPGAPTFDQGGVAFGPSGQNAAPSWRVNANASYQVTDFLRVDLQYRWRNRLKLTPDPTFIFIGRDSIRPYGQAAINLAFQIPEERFQKLEFFVNVQNLFDADPQPANATGTSASPGFNNGWAITDDPIGRYFTVGARMKF